MRQRSALVATVLVLAATVSAVWMSHASPARPRPTPPPPPPTWNARAAAAYLDQRQGWWESWPKAARDHGTACVSCHTAIPYALARPELGAAMGEATTPPADKKLVDDVLTRVRGWPGMKPFYGDTTPQGKSKAIESRGTEAVLNALVLASGDSRSGVVSSEARQAFANMFALQERNGDDAGAWPWIDFGLRPWESKTAVYFGAALAAVAIGSEPDHFAETPTIQPNVAVLREYLRTHLDQPLWTRLLRRDDPRLFNRAMLLWASARLPMLLSSDERQSIIAALWNAQQPDGAWGLTSLGYWHMGAFAAASTSDAVATGLVAYALEQAGTLPNEPHLARALAWLARNQDPATGMWSASSLNKKRDPSTNVGRFMSDAATGYAILALTGATAHPAGWAYRSGAAHPR